MPMSRYRLTVEQGGTVGQGDDDPIMRWERLGTDGTPVAMGRFAVTGENSFTARVVSKFLTSKLSLLFIIAALAAGAVGFLQTPREEEPQIVVPMVDVLINYPGASAEEVEKLVTTNLETKLLEIEGVEHVYSMSRPGEAVVSLRPPDSGLLLADPHRHEHVEEGDIALDDAWAEIVGQLNEDLVVVQVA